ncbi:hypothetical protein [uncultured Stenotrophomonas sp.]|nr:hypothetical protein [uncultured Stenotrophomonas sp.]
MAINAAYDTIFNETFGEEVGAEDAKALQMAYGLAEDAWLEP